MPTHKYGTINRADSTTTYAFGSSDSARISAAYPGTPKITDADLVKLFQEKVMDGTVKNGFCFDSVDRDYSNAPDIDAVDTGKHNLPSGYVPNPSSPGAGSLNPADVPAPPDGFGQNRADNWGTGVGSKLQPKQASAVHSTMKAGDYALGKGPGTTS